MRAAGVPHTPSAHSGVVAARLQPSTSPRSSSQPVACAATNGLVDQPFRDQHVQDGEHQRAVRPRAHRQPLGAQLLRGLGAARVDHDDRHAAPLRLAHARAPLAAHDAVEEVGAPEDDHPRVLQRRRVDAGLVRPQHDRLDEARPPSCTCSTPRRGRPIRLRKRAVSAPVSCRAPRHEPEPPSAMIASLPCFSRTRRGRRRPARSPRPSSASRNWPDPRGPVRTSGVVRRSARTAGAVARYPRTQPLRNGPPAGLSAMRTTRPSSTVASSGQPPPQSRLQATGSVGAKSSPPRGARSRKGYHARRHDRRTSANGPGCWPIGHGRPAVSSA